MHSIISLVTFKTEPGEHFIIRVQILNLLLVMLNQRMTYEDSYMC